MGEKGAVFEWKPSMAPKPKAVKHFFRVQPDKGAEFLEYFKDQKNPTDSARVGFIELPHLVKATWDFTGKKIMCDQSGTDTSVIQKMPAKPDYMKALYVVTRDAQSHVLR